MEVGNSAESKYIIEEVEKLGIKINTDTEYYLTIDPITKLLHVCAFHKYCAIPDRVFIFSRKKEFLRAKYT